MEAEDGMYVVEGPKIEKMLGYTNLDSEKGFAFFQKFLKETGILAELEAKGIQEGDTVKMYGFSLIIINKEQKMTTKQRAYLKKSCNDYGSHLSGRQIQYDARTYRGDFGGAGSKRADQNQASLRTVRMIRENLLRSSQSALDLR